MRVTGKYKKGRYFIKVYSNNAMYVIARNSGEWGVLKVGECDCQGNAFTLEQFRERESACEKTGTFDLKEA